MKAKNKTTAKPRKPKLITMTQYNKKMNEIIAKHDHVAMTLIEMLEFAATVRIK